MKDLYWLVLIFLIVVYICIGILIERSKMNEKKKGILTKIWDIVGWIFILFG
jgi:Na+-transporting methylmalonyl-CoA/oxaloacetate decarboxylase gamma subunit